MKGEKAIDEIALDKSTSGKPTRDWLGRVLSCLALGAASYACLLLFENELVIDKIISKSREVANIASALQQNEVKLRSDTEAAIEFLSKQQTDQLNNLKSNVERAISKRSTLSSPVDNWSIAEVE